jgi:hypothetical protein
VAPTKYIKVLIFGPPKVGKSLLAGKLASHFKLDWLDAENGSEVLRQLPIEHQRNINLFSFPDTSSYPIAVESWRKIVKGSGELKICHTHGKVSCTLCTTPELNDILDLTPGKLDRIIVFDSLTQFTNSAGAYFTNKLIKASNGKLSNEDVKFGFDEYGAQGRVCEEFLSHIQQAKYHLICISHEQEVELEDGKNKLVATLGTRNYSRNSAKAFGHVVYCDVKNGKHNFGSSTTYLNNVVSGSRTGAALEKMEIPSLLPIFRGEIPTPVEAKTPGQIALGNLKAGVR